MPDLARDSNTLMRIFLRSRYSVSNDDLATLVRRYLTENPNALDDVTKVYQELKAAAEA